MNTLQEVYAVYISALGVELYPETEANLAHGRFLCKQSNYSSILRFARNLACHRRIPLRNYVLKEA
ncbi:MAG: hypothetical protein O3C67_04775 [Cyanobacteria bacterium]|nr:hypothetical protein [Cyanobacteriota bacterium]MEB3269222.1 hypothetical protein [Leptolyngbya sp.]